MAAESAATEDLGFGDPRHGQTDRWMGEDELSGKCAPQSPQDQADTAAVSVQVYGVAMRPPVSGDSVYGTAFRSNRRSRESKADIILSLVEGSIPGWSYV